MKEGNDECHGLDSKTRNLRSKATSISGLFKLESTQRLRSLGPQFVNQPLEARDPALLYPFGAHRPTDTDNQIFSSVQFSRSVVSNSLRPHESQHARPPCPSPIPGVYPNSSPLSRWCHPTISSSVILSPPALNLSQHQGLFKWVSSSHQVAKVLELQLQHQSFQWTPRTDLL